MWRPPEKGSGRISREPLPVDRYLDAILDALQRARAVVVTAAPGAGKTTRVPAAVVDGGRVILLQPRRAAARAIARRIAEERGWTLGREVGWQIRFERHFTSHTRLLVATEGVLAARLQQDPLLSDFGAIVLDEFHERSIHADLAIALAKQAWRARTDLRLVVMSATIDAATVSAFLDGCPVVTVPGRLHPLEITYAPSQSVADAALEQAARTSGDVLCFLPGAHPIRQTIIDLERRDLKKNFEVVPLYGALPADEQDRALRAGAAGRRRIIVATNVAETSVTVPGVTGVVDSGLHKVARFDADRGIDSLTTERITADAAHQRAGRAGRLGPGVVCRLWEARDRLRPHREPEIHRVDLAAIVLDVLAWGGDPRRFEWFEAPRPEAVDAALALLERLGAVVGGRLTETGSALRLFPLHPRLSRILVYGGGTLSLARACAVIAERQFQRPRSHATSSDLLSAVDDWNRVPPHVQEVAREIARLAEEICETLGSPSRSSQVGDAEFRRAVLAGYPDRVAQRREERSPRVKLASGAGGVLTDESGVREGEFVVAIDVQRSERLDRPDHLVRVASRVEREWLQPTAVEVLHRFDAAAGVVRAVEVARYDALTLSERPVPPDDAIAARLLADAWLARGPQPADVQLLRRIAFAGRKLALAEAVAQAASGARSLDDIRLRDALTPDLARTLERDAPESLKVPSGRTVALEYSEGGGVAAAVKLQELFGLAETPRVGPRREPVLFALLAPNGRPVQLTRDLGSFWRRTYPDVRKELRGRYPKHPWPEDPWTATPTARTTSRKRP